jgi:hypothetical protein
MSEYLTINQDALVFVLDTKVDISGGSTFQIGYTKPSGDTGYWTGSRDGTTISFSFTAGDSELDESGLWTFWTKVTWGNGSMALGEPFEFYVHAEGEVHST